MQIRIQIIYNGQKQSAHLVTFTPGKSALFTIRQWRCSGANICIVVADAAATVVIVIEVPAVAAVIVAVMVVSYIS